MLGSYLTGIIGVVALLAIWVAVQLCWRKVFADAWSDPDALAGRMGCHGCSCETVCERKAAESAQTTEEGTP